MSRPLALLPLSTILSSHSVNSCSVGLPLQFCCCHATNSSSDFLSSVPDTSCSSAMVSASLPLPMALRLFWYAFSVANSDDTLAVSVDLTLTWFDIFDLWRLIISSAPPKVFSSRVTMSL